MKFSDALLICCWQCALIVVVASMRLPVVRGCCLCLRRAASNIETAEFQTLNPLLMCGVLPLTVGAPVCTGNLLSFCNNPVTATGGDTCDSLDGNVVGLPVGQTCATLASTSSPVPVCVAPANQVILTVVLFRPICTLQIPTVCEFLDASNSWRSDCFLLSRRAALTLLFVPLPQCAQDTICGVSISPALQNQLGFYPDYCSIISSCEVGLESLGCTLIGAGTALFRHLGAAADNAASHVFLRLSSRMMLTVMCLSVTKPSSALNLRRTLCFCRVPLRPAPLPAWIRWCSHSPAHRPQSPLCSATAVTQSCPPSSTACLLDQRRWRSPSRPASTPTAPTPSPSAAHVRPPVSRCCMSH